MAGRERKAANSGEVLVGVIPRRADLQLLESERWYRVPENKRPARWPPRWFAPYEGKSAGAASHIWRVAPVECIDRVSREQLFPGERPGPKAGRQYHVLRLGPLVPLPEPIRLTRARPLVFISTTEAKLHSARTINDLYDDSPLEDRMWDALKTEKIPAERQWPVEVPSGRRLIDFAVFCLQGGLAIETDGDSYHTGPEKAAYDNERNNDLAAEGWQTLRFSTDQVQSRLAHCLDQVRRMIDRLKGLEAERFFVPRGGPGAGTRQLALGEEPAAYDAELAELD